MNNELKASKYRKELKRINDTKLKMDNIDEWRIEYNREKIPVYIDKLCKKYNLSYIEDTLEYIDECDCSIEQKYIVEFDVIQNGKKYTYEEQNAIDKEFEHWLDEILLPHYRENVGVWVVIYFK